MRHSFKKILFANHKLSLPALIALVVSVLTITVFAYLSIGSGRGTHLLRPAPQVNPTITQDYKVNVGNTGYTMYVRAAVTVNWVNGNHVYAIAPALGTDYTVELGENWFYEGGFYYYKLPVESNKTTAALVSGFESLPTAVVPTDAGGNAYTLKLVMVAQTIQAKGTTDADNTPAVTDVWGITMDSNGHLVDLTP